MSTSHAAHRHHPIRVVDDLELDEHGRPARWLWHLECRTCGQPLDHDLTAADQAVEAVAVEAARIEHGLVWRLGAPAHVG